MLDVVRLALNEVVIIFHGPQILHFPDAFALFSFILGIFRRDFSPAIIGDCLVKTSEKAQCVVRTFDIIEVQNGWGLKNPSHAGPPL